MKQRLMLVALSLVVMLLMTGCMPQSATVEPENTEKVALPELPESIQRDDTGVPLIRVYNVKDEAIEEMDIEEYLAGVLAGEMKNDWPMEALKAQAILARTFVLKFISTKESKYEGADISTDVSEAQAYDADAINERIRTAVQQTRGLVMSDDGELPYAWFHAHSGGVTELPSAALEYEGDDPDYLSVHRVSESDSAPEDVKQWTAQFTKQQIQQACSDAGVSVGSISSVEIGKKGESGRAITLIVNGKSVSAPALRLALDASKLKSTLIESIELTGDQVTFTGRGFGHGVGMSQWGAYALAERGEDAEDIVEEFFDDVDIVRLWT